MTNRKRRLPVSALILLAAAVILLAISGAQTARAALSYTSGSYRTQVSLREIGVTLLENGTELTPNAETGEAALLGSLLQEGEQIKLGYSYPEAIRVKNSGTIDEYVRVKLYTYWTDGNGNKVTNLSPQLIELNLLTDGTGWVEDTSAATAERRVLYYSGILAAGAETPDLTDTLTISSGVAYRMTETRATDETTGQTTVTATYTYNGMQFHVRAEVDAVQTHSAAAAIKSAWGVDVSVDENGVLSLLNQQPEE